jgi:tRNA (adenine37-N6)-methyltransferase
MKNNDINLHPVGYVSTDAEDVPNFYTVSDIEGRLVIDEQYLPGLLEIEAGMEILVVFQFHKSPPFTDERLRVTPPHHDKPRGVFATRSPVRPNPIGISVLTVTKRDGSIIHVSNLDMLDGTPILDIKSVQ